MVLTFAPTVENDLEEIADYIAEDNPVRAVGFILEFRNEFKRIAQNPFLYQLRPEIGQDSRKAVVGRYVILFRIMEDSVRIERVVFGGRDLPALLE